MKHFYRASTHPTVRAQHTNHASTTLRCWQILLGTAFLCLGLVSESLACHTPRVTPTSLTYYVVQGATTPPNQTITFSRTATDRVTLTASDNATWLTVSPATTSMTASVKLTTAVNMSGRAAGTYNATITMKMGTWCTYPVKVTVIVSPSTTLPPSPTSTATLTWNPVTSTAVSGYKVYVGEAPRLYTRTINVGTATSSTVTGLTVGKTYYFVVTALNGAGESAPSNEVSKTIQ